MTMVDIIEEGLADIMDMHGYSTGHLWWILIGYINGCMFQRYMDKLHHKHGYSIGYALWIGYG
jgi:hypothetical protein